MWFSEFSLSGRRLEKLSDIASDLALVSVASVTLPAVFDKYDIVKIIVGILIAIVFWIICLWLRR